MRTVRVAVTVVHEVVVLTQARVHGNVAELPNPASGAMADESTDEVQTGAIVHTRLDSTLVDILAASPSIPCVAVWAWSAGVGAVQIDAWCQSSTAAVIDKAFVDIIAADRPIACVALWTRPTLVRPWNVGAIRDRIAASVVCSAFVDVNTVTAVPEVSVKAAAGVVPLAEQLKSIWIEVALGTPLACFGNTRAVINVPRAWINVAGAVIYVR